MTSRPDEWRASAQASVQRKGFLTEHLRICNTCIISFTLQLDLLLLDMSLAIRVEYLIWNFLGPQTCLLNCLFSHRVLLGDCLFSATWS